MTRHFCQVCFRDGHQHDEDRDHWPTRCCAGCGCGSEQPPIGDPPDFDSTHPGVSWKFELANLASAFGLGDVPVRSDFKIQRAHRFHEAIVTVRPQVMACRVARIEIVNSNPAHWIVNDIQIGNRHRLLPAPIGGGTFGPSRDVRLELPVCMCAQDFRLDLRYIGPDEAGEEFQARLYGYRSPA